MKKRFSILLAGILGLAMATSCSSDDDAPNNNVDPVDDLIVLQGNIATRTLTKNEKYLIRGQVFVRDGQTLTIEPGTVVLGEKSTKGTLVIDRGGKIIAEGTVNEPIVMTSNLPAGSRDRGDWGGLVILGKARTNQNNPEIEGISPAVVFGGTDDNDDSGALKYIRVEFAGIELTPNNETNSITMGGVGKQFTMEYAMVSYGGDDGFEWFGGNNDGKYLVAFGMWDDDFDVDFGYTGRNQFGLGVRYASFADQSGSNGFECDNGPNDDVTQLLTEGVFSNFTILGPRLTSGQSISSNFQHALDFRRRTAVTIANSVFVGYPRGIRMNQQSVATNFQNGIGNLLNNYMLAPTQTFLKGFDGEFDLEAFWNATNEINTGTDFPSIYANLGLRDEMFFGDVPNNQFPSDPNYAVNSGALLSGASFTHPKLSDGYFDVVNYRGAFSGTDWTNGWAEFDPISKEY